jgi:uncharacterized ion transporter superfamily protein YfcC
MAKAKKFPDTILIILGFLLVFILLTHLVPAGEFEQTEVNGRMVIVPGTYHNVEAQPQGIRAIFTAPIRGFVKAAQIIAFVFLVGGSFSMLNRTGAIDAGLYRIIQFSQRHPAYRRWILPLVITLFSLGGATFGMAEEVLVFVLISIPLALALGYDSLTGLAVSFVGAAVGFAGAFINPFTIGIAQGIASLAPASGMGYRLLVWALFTGTAILYIMRYASRVERNPEASPMYELDRSRGGSNLQSGDENLQLTRPRKLVLSVFFLSLALLIFGVSQWGWYIDEISGLFLAMGLVAALLARLPVQEAIDAFRQGASDMMNAALVIGLAMSLVVVAQDGRIIDTLLHAMASATEGLPRGVMVEVMFLLQSTLNFFVPSGSGQAALTMPIMAPLSDLLGISRQTAVLAYQFGDGISNLIIPTSGVLMGILSVARVPYTVWLRWIMPLFLLLTLLAMLLLLPPVYWFTW